ncbi:transmembrane protein 51b [Paralichthys olivaceus]|uniref:transmembrane protein 51b n=1 Tax=Paralichthys olivaceus TaxID=8255 RepID=UPI00097D3C8B|nr:PREDICTED: transmembrane protein 51-like [Paralichthys olivaceus]XP_019956990.1 PREDICTED: transmembrane protein 51-like [Paralichthys olivaceus]
MCSNRSICGGNNRPNRSSSEGTSSGAHYALCALGIGLIALGIVMIVWTVIPTDGDESGLPSSHSVNSTSGPDGGSGDEEETDHTKSSSVAMVLVGVGAAMLLLSLCLGLRSKRRARNRPAQPVAAGGPLMDHVPGDQEEAADPITYNVPSYEEVIGSEDYPVRQSNLRSSTSQLPSYEDIIAAVENEGTEPKDNPTEDTPLSESTPAPVQPAAEPAQADPPGLTPNPSLPTRSTSRASRLLRPLRVRRIKSDKLHLKDFRLQIRTPTQNPVTIEPITPPPQYDNKMPELQ